MIAVAQRLLLLVMQVCFTVGKASEAWPVQKGGSHRWQWSMCRHDSCCQFADSIRLVEAGYCSWMQAKIRQI